MSMYCNLRNLHSFLHGQDHGHLSLHNNGHINDLEKDLQLWNLHSFLHGQDHGHLPLHNNEHVNNLVQGLQL